MKHIKFITWVIVLISFSLSACDRQTNTLLPVELRLIASGFTSPVALVAANDRSQRLFVVDQIGIIWIIADGTRLEKPFLDIRGRLVKLNDFYDERGLLGLALHPDFAANGRFYVSYSAPLKVGMSPDAWDHTTYISEFTISAHDPNQADPTSERVVMELHKPGYNYEAGHLEFGPDGYLYIATGDSVRDPASEAGKYAQDTFSLLGKILRIAVDGRADSVPSGNYWIPAGNPFADGVGGRAEVYAYGFRNPYRFSFDVSDSGEMRLFVADVGQAMMEEVDLVEAGKNYGWPIHEGTSCFNSQRWDQPLESCSTQGLSEPILAYPHQGDLSAAIGGIVYRGAAIPELKGGYVFGDWGRGNGHLFVAFPPQWSITEIQIEIPGDSSGIGQLLGIGQDQSGELYLLTKAPGIGATGDTGLVYQVVPPRK
ncbi:MAG TPA: PQQ-dependent sugar dehydrogenase [Anaerolineales bacterium]|nr:PQQ-dependent sugar dehydrogenase [Anaerolineales bacterium]